MAERLGNKIHQTENDKQGACFTSLMELLPSVLPCMECQKHMRDYVSEHPIPSYEGRPREEMRTMARQWLFDFHNAVRHQKGQSVELSTVEDCKTTYLYASITHQDYSNWIRAVAVAMRNQWVYMEDWQKWYELSETLRLTLKSIVV
jgi:hypothetical protein